MRAFLALLLLLALLPPPAVQAQATSLMEDPPGDVRSEVSGTPGPPAALLYPGADLLALAVEETDALFTFRLGLAALPDAKDAGADGVIYDVLFAHNGREFQLQTWLIVPALQPAALVEPPITSLSYRDSPDADWSMLWFTDAAAFPDAAGKSLAVQVLRLDLVDAQGAPPHPGRFLDGIRVQSRGVLSDATLVSTGGTSPPPPPQKFLDDMPDDPAAAGSVAVLIGPAQTGHARLTSLQPYRSSNGEATTFVYEVIAHNLGDGEDQFELSAPSLPHGYSVVLPVPVVSIPAQSTASVPVLLTMPFGHQHGSSSSFILEMRSVSDPGSVGRMEMGVRFLAVPQPAGHHDTVYLHKGPTIGGLGPLFGYRHGYINTLEDDPSDTGENYHSGWLNIPEAGKVMTRWVYGLEPGLLMGLDVDAGKVGRIRIPLGTTSPMVQTTVQATLLAAPGINYPDPDKSATLATMAPTAPFDLMPKSEVVVEGDLVPDPDAGRIPYKRGVNLWLLVDVTTTGDTWSAGSEGAYIAPGGSAVLPLREWHDPVDEVLAAVGGPGLSALGPQERLVNRGEAAVFPVSIANPLDVAATVRFEVSGSNAEWASLPTGSVTVPAHGTAQASVVVRAPASANDQERADLVLQAYSKDHPEARGLLRLVAEVDTDADQPDDTALAAEASGRDSPGAGLAAPLAALAALALARRRAGR